MMGQGVGSLRGRFRLDSRTPIRLTQGRRSGYGDHPDYAGEVDHADLSNG